MDTYLYGFVSGILCVLVLRSIARHRGKPQNSQPAGRTLYEIAETAWDRYVESARPADLLAEAPFKRGVALLLRPSYTTKDLLAYASGDNPAIACMALEALRSRKPDPDVRAPLLAGLSSYAPWPAWYALRCLSVSAGDRPLAGEVLLRLHPGWQNPPSTQVLEDFATEREAAGEQPAFGDDLDNLTAEQGEFLPPLLEGLRHPFFAPLKLEFENRKRSRVDVAFLNTVGIVWSPGGRRRDPVLTHPAMQSSVEYVLSRLRRDTPRSVLLSGEPGVGKSAIIRAAAEHLQIEGWTIFEAGHTELVAGQVYIGQLEQRLRDLVDRLGGERKVLWYIPDLPLLAWTGRSLQSPVGLLDHLLPYLENNHVTVISEAEATAYEKLLQSHPRCATVLDSLRIEPLKPRAARALASEWASTSAKLRGHPPLSEQTLSEAWLLAQQYLASRAAPGNVLDLLKRTRDRMSTAGSATDRALSLDDLIVTLTQLSGLPAELLDERRELDLDALRELFRQRVMGQPEAVDCLVERVAMIKAGLNDPTRPLGVFLFAGPTGTGKTEIAKTLSEFLFGAKDRLLRLDMSEFQAPDSINRILGQGSEREGDSLVEQIRKQPFSLVLLDEFEKACPDIWDLFLQVFDDGRLTDRRGRTTDCRHCMFIMTSNLGAAIPSGHRLGFGAGAQAFSAADVETVIRRVFRPEFLNRLDRVVVFRPLTRETMRDILKKEVDAVAERRGLRNRTWAVVWDESAYDFLLEKGFTADLGARPLQRAIERYLLTPLSITIVGHQFPEGDQFLFVRSGGGKLIVEFIDPDAPDDAPAPPQHAEALRAGHEPTVQSIILEPHGIPAEVSCLDDEFRNLRTAIESESWRSQKREALERMQDPDFWSNAERFAVLGDVEYRDRLESALRTAVSLNERLVQRSGARGAPSPSRQLVHRFAQQILLIREACKTLEQGEPLDAFLLVEGCRDKQGQIEEADLFAGRISEMYRAWGTKRRMSLDILDEQPPSQRTPYRLIAAVSGFGAWTLLRPETGLHVFELPEGDTGAFRRAKARVRVTPQPAAPVDGGREAWLAAARACLSSTPDVTGQIVRRYRELPSPLVRDGVRNWRTGRLDKVLDGNFDLFA